MNDTLKRRLTGLAVLLVLVFALSLLLPHSWPESGETGVPSATVPLAVNPGGADDATPPSPATAAQTPGAQQSAPPPVQTASTASEPTPVSAIDMAAPQPEAQPAPTHAPKPAAAPAPAPPKPEVSHEAKPAPPKPAVVPPPVMPKPSLTLAKPTPPQPAPVLKPTPPPVTPRLATSIQVPPPPAAAGRIWFVQIGSFADQGNAQTTLNLLQNIGYRGESQPISNASGKTLYRVRLGPFTSEPAGQQALDKVTHQGYPQARLLAEEGKR
jgi:DedD protein